ncbi:MAG: UDP-N-acetylmuramoyl-L-alanyl-D-glutamate--2,6-diaminopimelate ligase [Actinomycetota bacterium]|nr:UDP-N-acetylmuramoyl-L-alanyl-D-glutamate--2,6-diaminopimelate ligase [Actinomycetota bacterium]
MERLLGALVADASIPDASLHGNANVVISGVVHDSRRVAAGSLFCCVPGGTVDGHVFADAAVAAGAAALLVERPLAIEVPQLVVPDSRVAMGLLAASFFEHPCRALVLVGVTGTNGKTTTTALIAAILEHAGVPCGVIGTLTGKHTTPEAPELQERLAAFVAAGKRAVVMEVSSHALALHRVVGCQFAAAVFTNLGRDHLDLHGTEERYFAAKAALFTHPLSDRGVVNVDDPHGRLLADAATIPITEFSMSEVTDVEITPGEHAYTWRGERIRVGIGGAFNAMNSLAAATTAAELGVAPATIAAGLRRAPAVPGRFEAVRAGQAFDVIVDYAHTPDGLRAALSAARAASSGQLIAVFGCGGDRDREKRPQMGAVAAELADRVVITSDNPRSEDPLEIINAVFAGVPDDYRARVVTEPERRRAFALAFHLASDGDVVVIAGKGHETTQTIGTREDTFDDRVVARELLEGAS